MTTGIDQATEVADLIQELTQQSQSVAERQRDASVAAGTILSEVDVDGAQFREVKQSSMVRSGKVALPERFMAFDKFGNVSMLPTAQMHYHLGKHRPDSPGELTYHTHRAGVTRETCSICPAEKQPIDALCDYCTGVRGQRPTFFSETDLFTHKRRLHPDELDAEERELDRAERRAALATQNKLAEAMLAAAQANQAPPALTVPATPPTEKSKKD